MNEWDASTPERLYLSVCRQLRAATTLPESAIAYLANGYVARYVRSGWWDKLADDSRPAPHVDYDGQPF